MYLLYSLLLGVLLAISSPWWLVQMLRLGKYRAGLAERFGRVPSRIRITDSRRVAWIHAVSVGEVLAISTLVERLRAEGFRVVVSTTTHTGQRLARDKFGAENVFFFPLDFAFCIRPYMAALRPALVILAETEFWPNFLRIARENGARLAVVNARISDRSFPRYRKFRKLLRHVLSPVHLFLSQSEEDARRLVEIGAPRERVQVSGNVKFDVQPPSDRESVARLGAQLDQSGAQPVIVAGSTVDGEEPIVLAAFTEVLRAYPRATLILAPRHKERFAEVATLVEKSGVKALRRSALQGAEDVSGGVLLLDTLGELASGYRYATISFVGGSLVPRGGHNILEPAFFARPILTGPYTENFRDIRILFERANAVFRCDASSLAGAFLHLLQHESEREALGQRARAVLESQRGATERSVESLMALAAETTQWTR